MKAKDIRVGDYWDNQKVTSMAHSEEYVYLETEDGRSHIYVKDDNVGCFIEGENRLPFKGDIILVRNNDNSEWEERICIDIRNNKVICCAENWEEESEFYETRIWKKWKWPDEKNQK